MENMRLEKIQEFLKEKDWKYTYTEEEGVGSIDFENRGISYHIWEFCEGEEYGAESNVRSGGKQEDFFGDYEEEIISVIKSWK
ncbi:MAG: kinase [Eubacteriales bacterium]|nr:kinase [Eubacteriales bacterium]